MKKLILCLLVIALVSSCAPWQKNNVSVKSIAAIESLNAINDWKKTTIETDKCSSTNRLHWFAETFLDKNWCDCCVQHDFDYREGGKYGITKEQADYELWECVDASGHPFVAKVVYDAVFLFGGSSYIEYGVK